MLCVIDVTKRSDAWRGTPHHVTCSCRPSCLGRPTFLGMFFVGQQGDVDS